jgi:hypothetical protein
LNHYCILVTNTLAYYVKGAAYYNSRFMTQSLEKLLEKKFRWKNGATSEKMTNGVSLVS